MRLTPTLVSLALGASLQGIALAQEPPAEAEATPAPTIATLHRALAAAEAAGADQAAEATRLSALIEAAGVMLDRRKEDAPRIAAVETMAKGRDPRVLPLLWVASGSSSSSVRAAIIAGVADWDNVEALTILSDRARSHGEMLSIREVAIAALQKTGKPAAAEVLYKIAIDQAQRTEARDLALQALEASFADFLKGKARPMQAGDRLGLTAAMAGNALAGGVLLSSVGIWGQGDAAPAIGGLGGTAIGAGTAYMYNEGQPITRGQGLAYASNTAWGLAGGLMTSHIFYDDDAFDRHESMSALIRSVGVGVGAYTGFQRMGRDPSPQDVMKVNAAGFVGSQLGRSGTGLVQSFSDSGGDRTRSEQNRVRTVAAMAGAAAGLAAGSAFQDDWVPTQDDVLFSGIVGTETMVASSMIPLIAGSNHQMGSFMDFGFFAGTTTGMWMSHGHHVPQEQSILIGYGALTGNLFGLGTALLIDVPSEGEGAAIVLPAGIAGAVAGGWAHQYIKPTHGDWAMVGVGTALSAAQLGAITFVLTENEFFNSEQQPPGLILTGTTLASAGFLTATRFVEPDPLDSLLMGSAAGWGALYGSVGQVALGTDLSDAGAVLATTLAADVGMGLGAAIISERTATTPTDTMVPQLCGVAGATLGSLGVLLSTEEEQPVAIGALTGATVGLGVGAIIGPRLNLGNKPVAMVWDMLPKPNLDPPGQWSFSGLPAMQADGTMGTVLSLSAHGL